MSGSHEKLPKLFWVQLALAAIVLVLFLTADKPSKNAEAAHGETKEVVKQAAAKLAPVGEVAVKEETVASTGGAGRSGDAIYNAICQTCHNTGVANAPKLDDKPAWESRMANGIDGLVKTAISGKGAMPPKGGDMSLTDAEIKSVVEYMLGKVGIETSSAAAPVKDEKKEMAKKEAPVATKPETPTMTEKPETPTMAEKPAAPEAPAAPAAPVAEATTATAAIATTAATPASAPPSPERLAQGEKVYKGACFACHDAGVAGSPKIADKAAWSARIATGKEAMYTSAINGKGVMPPKGGNMGISDDDVKAAVDYMVTQSM